MNFSVLYILYPIKKVIVDVDIIISDRDRVKYLKSEINNDRRKIDENAIMQSVVYFGIIWCLFFSINSKSANSKIVTIITCG